MKRKSRRFDESSSDSNDEKHNFGLYEISNKNMFITKKIENDQNQVYEIDRKLQETKLSAVFLLTDSNYVMKCIPKDIFMKCQQEVKLMRDLDHPNIMKIHDFILKERYAAIIMPRAKSDLIEYVQPRSSYIEEHYICVVIKSALEALSYLHKNGVWHRDIKLENILVMKETVKGPIINISDFGLSCNLIKKEPQGFKNLECVGTLLYAAPELIERDSTEEYGIRFREKARYNCTIDIWSLGITMYCLFTKIHPFLKDNKYDLDAAEKGQIDFDLPGENPFIGVSDFAKDVILAMLNPSPAGRNIADDVLRMEWFKHFSVSKPVMTSTYYMATQQLAQSIYMNEKQE